jgi:hypothetical protein
MCALEQAQHRTPLQLDFALACVDMYRDQRDPALRHRAHHVVTDARGRGRRRRRRRVAVASLIVAQEEGLRFMARGGALLRLPAPSCGWVGKR